jgi:amidophosphoribosyltransferase
VCGIFGIFGHPEAANIAYLGLHALQHRGQESAGIAASGADHRLRVERTMGLVQAGFTPAKLGQLPGRSAIGHVRYSTAGTSDIRNAQPLLVDYRGGSVAVAHNGNITNYAAIRRRLEARGSIFQSSTDSEAILHLMAMSEQPTLVERIVEALTEVEGAYSLLFMDEHSVVAVRDPMGFRPLCLGVVALPAADASSSNAPAFAADMVALTAVGRPSAPSVAGRAIVVSSEPTSFDLIGAEHVRDLEPGEVLIIDEAGMRSLRPFAVRPRRTCVFEYVYFARPDSVLDATSVYEVRKACGRKLLDEQPVPTGDGISTVVVPVPDSGLPAAIGLAARAGLPFEMGLIRSHYVGRTFIEPQQAIRNFGVRLKLNPNCAALDGKRVIVVDDSIVRGTTSRKLVSMLRAAGAVEVHVRISSPPTEWPCFYGIDTPRRSELIAARHAVDEIRRFLGADSLGYLSLEGLLASVQEAQEKPGPRSVRRQSSRPPSDGGARAFCHACFSGEYPTPVEGTLTSLLELPRG